MKPLDLSPNARWRQRYRAPTPLYQFIAPLAPERGLLADNRTGIYQLYAWDIPTGRLRQLTNRPEGMVQAALAPDGRYVYYLDDRQGNEIGHFARFAYDGTWSAEASQDLTPGLPLYSTTGIGFSRANNQMAFVVCTPVAFDLYVQPLGADEVIDAPRLIFHGQSLISEPVLSEAGALAVFMSTERTGRPEYSLVALDTASGKKIGELWDGAGASLQTAMFSPAPGDERLLATTTRSGLEQLLLWNPRSGERRDLVFPDVSGAASAHDWSPDGTRLLFSTLNRAVQHLYLYDLATDDLTHLEPPSGTITSAAFAPTGEIFGIWSDSATPPRSVALNGATAELARLLLPASAVPAGRRWRSVHFPSSDGEMIQGWLATPEGQGPFPAIIDMIGGPTGVRAETYMPSAQAWLDHGCAFLSVNYRGCSTFGQAFESKIFGNPGYWEVEDIVAARRYLVESGLARPDQVLLTGWSYGGYLTLMSLGRYPDLWAGGMAGIAIADWTVQYEDTADALRGFQIALLGGTPQEKADQYALSSPITYAEQVRAPVLVIQGRHDTRTPARPLELYEARMQALGKSIEVEWFDTGHLGSFADVELAIRHQERMMRFAYRLIGQS